MFRDQHGSRSKNHNLDKSEGGDDGDQKNSKENQRRMINAMRQNRYKNRKKPKYVERDIFDEELDEFGPDYDFGY